MKQIYKYFFLFSLSFSLAACGDFDEMNKNPNSPQTVPTQSLISYAEKSLVNAVRSTTLSISGANLYVQWLANNTYTDTDRYYWLSTTGNSPWSDLYLVQNNLDEIISLNSDESTRLQAALNGSNNNQIAATRILKVWAYQIMTDAWGDIPYNSYSGKNPSFDAGGAANNIIYPQYASQEDIYLDLLNELKEASEQLDINQPAFIKGDAIYQGDASKWQKFANSLSLRVANRIRHRSESANNRIKEIISNPDRYPIFKSNADNATLAYETTAPNQAPFYVATILANRNDYAVSNVLIDFLKGEKGPFQITDPRLEAYAQPNIEGEYTGQTYGLDAYTASLGNPNMVSKPGKEIYKSNYKEVLMEYSEVEFILSESKNWAQENYVNGIRASMQKWGVEESLINQYISQVTPANAETVLSQKWVALFMQGAEAWAEYRRTGYPDFLVKKGDVIWRKTIDGQEVIKRFDPIGINTLPARLLYPNSEIELNTLQYQKAINRQGADELTTQIWWNKVLVFSKPNKK
ncbi:SusD/RagB family nutrient-binding outer membrane lipoprotein [Bacteroides sp.]|uniref:SusD/RagB family nutrient-binding outer membrane lipoprotein n=1 Tax=Bacteroides sp. TaxID=29523 RepID=UPI002FCB44E3